jgi:2-keto-3-deoxy-L-rhamnonate aldolase RhmA
MKETMPMTANKVKIALLERTPTLGGWIQLGHGAIAEILGRAGFDWVCADLEHGDFDSASLAAVFRALEGTGAVPFARVQQNDTLQIRRVLDMGAAGVIVPLVDDSDAARRAVAAARYPPAGRRGFAYVRANAWGVDFDTYTATANRDVVVIVMIESRSAVENIDAILEVDGVDGVLVGPYDMSGSYGVIGQTSHPLVKNACRHVASACHAHGKSAGLHIVVPDEDRVRAALDDGFTFLALGMDTVFLTAGATQALVHTGLRG